MASLDDLCKRMMDTNSRKSVDDADKKGLSDAAGAGLETRVIRTYDDVGLHGGKDDCEFCKSREGEWNYREAVQHGVFQRHPGCECEIETSVKKSMSRHIKPRDNTDAELIKRRSKFGIDASLEAMYNSPPGPKSIGELREIYIRDVTDGWISPLSGFDNYLKLYSRIETEIIGQETPFGIVIKSQSEHFLTRVIGTSLNPSKTKSGVYKITGTNPQGYRSNARSGVDIDDIKDTLNNGIVKKEQLSKGGRSIKIVGKICEVTINPDTGNLIQCNLRGDL